MSPASLAPVHIQIEDTGEQDAQLTGWYYDIWGQIVHQVPAGILLPQLSWASEPEAIMLVVCLRVSKPPGSIFGLLTYSPTGEHSTLIGGLDLTQHGTRDLKSIWRVLRRVGLQVKAGRIPGPVSFENPEQFRHAMLRLMRHELRDGGKITQDAISLRYGETPRGDRILSERAIRDYCLQFGCRWRDLKIEAEQQHSRQPA
jgi:hypothetical protein